MAVPADHLSGKTVSVRNGSEAVARSSRGTAGTRDEASSVSSSMKLWLAPAIACAAATGCAHPATGVEAQDAARWSYDGNSARAPIASYGVPYTATQLSMECVPAEQAVHLITIDTPIAEDRPVAIRVGGASLAARETLDPPDGMATSRISIPLREPILERFAAGDGPLTILAAQEEHEYADGPLPRQMIRDCLRLRRD